MNVLVFVAILLAWISVPHAQAQVSKVLFQDDFSSNTIDPAKYQPDAPFFEGGIGDIHATAHDGVIEFVGTTSQQWWSGATLSVAPTFTATEQANLTVSIDRVAEAGVGTASRSALWILDETKTRYVLFADVRGEGGWRYNRKIGEDGDVPTGSGTDIAAFNGGNFDDGLLHRMKLVANGQTVKLYLDGQLGAEVKFPFSKVIIQFGSYARANNDTASTTWDNLLIETTLPTKVLLEDDFASNTIDPGRYQPDAPFFEGGLGDIHAEAHDGVIEFVGTTSQQWWSGATLRVAQTFTATDQTVVSASIDRVAEAGVGTASRSALWILDETQTRYVLFADVRGEGGWRFNRKIGEDGDVPTGSGTDILAFNGGDYDNGLLHRMKIVADGQTAKLYLGDVLGAEVKFPFSRVIFHFGSYARANNDTASTTWDNLKIETTVRQTTVVFEDDFASNTIDPGKYQPDAPFFEGGVGDIHAEAHDGVIEFLGTTTQQWWSGATLRIVPTFEASEASVVTLGIDRVAEAGVGTASRSALWILDESKTQYVLFADVRGEGGWRYNRKIGEDGDVPTGSGTDILAFNGGNYDDGLLHRMSMIADGKTVKLLLDGLQGAEVKFPFSPVVFQFGAYARANNDTASTKWDNLVIETAGGATFEPTSVSVRPGQLSSDVTVKIPAGLNAQNSVQMRVVSGAPNIAVPEGATGGTLTLTFAAGGANTQTFKVRGVALGGALFSLDGDVPGGNQLDVAVISGPALLLEDNFAAATINTANWQISNAPFEGAGTGTFTVAPTTGVLQIEGSTDSDPGNAGASLKTVKGYQATADLLLNVEVNRVAMVQAGVAARTGVFITTADRSRFVFFGQNIGANGWSVNVNPGNPTGAGTAIAAFAGITDADNHRIKMVADGSTVEVFLDSISGGRFPFTVTSGIHVELGAYAQGIGDYVVGHFDNVRIENVMPCNLVSPQSLTMTSGDPGQSATVTIPSLLHDAASATVTITSQNPGVAVPAGSANGVLTLTFPAAGANSQSFTVRPVGLGRTEFTIVSAPQNCLLATLTVEVVCPPKVLLSDDFSGASLDPARWTVDPTPFDSGTATAESAVTIAGGQLKADVIVENALWPGFAVMTAQSYTASQTAPVTFEVDRMKVEFVLTTGTGAEQRTGVWVKDAAGHSVFLNDYVAHDGRNYGWRYNKVTGGDDDDATGIGVNIPAFDGGTFDDRGRHLVKVVANGATVKLYLDGVFGAEVPFPFAQGLTFGVGTYCDEAGNVARGFFDNAVLRGECGAEPPRLSAVTEGANIVISWTGDGVLQSTPTLGTPTWTDVTPAPTGKSVTIPISSSGAARFYGLRP